MEKPEEKKAFGSAFGTVWRFESRQSVLLPRQQPERMEKQLAVFFPGTGYSCDQPLLYYARRAAEQAGCDVLPLTYQVVLDRNCRNMTQEIQHCLSQALHAAGEALRAVFRRQPYRELFFFSKSFGTVVAGGLERRLTGKKVHQFFLTPLEATLPYMQAHPCFAASGTADSWVTTEIQQKMQHTASVQMYLFPGANHSLEIPGNVAASVQNMQLLLEAYTAFLCGNHRNNRKDTGNI
ncbi:MULTISPECIES: hypothetical protein [Caproicibacterium]|jgi:hypothetical protein|uniref:Alpha/beta hydrolase n=1 Tax=Caproicibacterium lactatifermentans TaxID=2666138 RepID=A0A859DSA3_9FIRM|nr:hypothetical protein [Caproicibacterium lactatifermentans]ARP50586.1 hypothetical protein B6259_06665 [Ruminococcaceae bacterium CPB6]MDD4807464.1 hypothetical protein [Oscillospiraceae bacterium]QKN23672.1 hypothetical protein GJQ69_03770 [Caproicibacterium lactatifermentans]QKO29655.1 hypothetical protein GKP14_00600 [Caproicibacterium lactatifermentans]